MTHMLVVILHDMSRLPILLNAWKQAGIPGVTLMYSMGGFQAENWLNRIGLGGLIRLFDADDIRQRLLISVINDDEILERAISEADRVVGGFDRPHSGILFTLPVSHSLGIRKRGSTKPAPAIVTFAPENLPQIEFGRGAHVSDIVKIMDMRPITVQADQPLQSIVSEMIIKPRVQVACVVNREDRLIGLIDLEKLADAFFFTIFPEEYLSEIKDVDEVMEFAQHIHERLAEDIMRDPLWIRLEDTLENAFRLMHGNNLSGLPVIDEHFHVTGYIALLDLMNVCLPGDTALKETE